jgi:hypothetical protein
MKAILKAFALLVALLFVVTIVTFVWIGSRGISAKATPGRLESVIARMMRGLAIPRLAHDLKNPVARSPEIVAEDMAHYQEAVAKVAPRKAPASSQPRSQI